MKIGVAGCCRLVGEQLSKVLAFVSNAVQDSKISFDGDGVGKVDVPADVLEPRQIKIKDTASFVPCVLKFHRDSRIPIIDPAIARMMVQVGEGEWVEDQAALVYTMAAYLADKDVNANEQWAKDAKQMDADGVVYVLVAIVPAGKDRGVLTLVRNIASGCHKGDVTEAAKLAMTTTRTFLVEEIKR